MEEFEDPNDIDDWVKLAEAIRAEQDTKPITERVHIGGALILTVLGGAGTASQEIHRFDDFDSAWNAMNEPDNP
jgi:hypothetical protein